MKLSGLRWVLIQMTLLFLFSNGYGSTTAEIRGKILDKGTNLPVEYATISVFNMEGGSLVTGTISGENGQFSISDIKKGEYFLKIEFIGYKAYVIDQLEITGSKTIDIGTVFLEEDSKQLEEIVVLSQANEVEYKIDKKVVSVAKELSSASMTAVEVLENVPSVRVDFEGNVLLRGSSSFIVLVDGKPTVLEPSDVLRQIPASNIQNIEIITNPSSKYQPDGSGGIINVITKKNRVRGASGLFNGRLGSFGAYGADFLLNYNKGGSNMFLGADIRESTRPNEVMSRRVTEDNDTTTLIVSNGTGEFIRSGWGVRGGWDWNISDKDKFSLEGRVGHWMGEGGSQSRYSTVQMPGDFLLDEATIGSWSRGGLYMNFTSTLSHAFAQENEELMLQVNYGSGNSDEKNETYLLDGVTNDVKNGSAISETGPSGGWEIRLDYTKPIANESSLELGSHIRLREINDDIRIFDYDADIEELILQPEKSNDIDYRRDIYGVYGVYKGKSKALGYQFGLRGEYTKRNISSTSSLAISDITRLDYFPTFHFSYDLKNENQLMANYTRRINRPRSWYLEPFITWSDMFNVRQGNPDLLPEYIHAFEINYIKNWESSRLSLETYYRITQNKVDRITSVYDEGVLLSSFDNIGTDYAFGVETMYNIKVIKWWELNVTGNLFYYEIKSEIEDSGNLGSSSFNWNARVSNVFNIWSNLKLQLDGSYYSPTVTVQGKDKSYYTVNMGLKNDFFKRKLSVTLQVRDIFASGIRVSEIQTPTVYNYRSRFSKAPYVTLNLSYKFNNYQRRRTRQAETEDF